MTKVLKKDKPKLPKTFKTKWVNALRSGDYRQTQDQLWDSWYSEDDEGHSVKLEGYCCLGVAACVLGKEKKLIQSKLKLTEFKSLPVEIKTVMKTETKNVDSQGKPMTIEDTLAYANDAKQWSFKKIANWIDKNL